ncbi:MAG: InlB B-repeat-containing protein [Lachnospiraceae bacterium]|nr:InlB B-repeat-containing protein [Lachnospiraceae bacterium]
MKKLRRFLAMLLTLLLCVGEFAATGLTVHAANEYDLWVGGVRVTDDNKDDIPGVTGEGAKASYDPDTQTLTFENVTGFAGTSSDAYIYTKDDLTIEGNVSSECDDNYCILSEKNVTIKGNVSFRERGIHYDIYETSKISVEDLIIDGGSLNVSSEFNDATVLICSNLFVRSGTVFASKESIYYGGAINVKNELKIEDGSVEGRTDYTDTAFYIGKLTMTGGSLAASNDYYEDKCPIAIGEITSEESIVVQKPVGGKVVKGSSGYWIVDSEGNTAHDVILKYGKDYDLWVGGVRVTSANKDNIPAVSGTGAKASYDPEKNTLTFENATIANAYNYNSGRKAGIYAENIPLTIKGKVSIVPEGIDSTFFGVYLKGTGTQKLTFDGDVTISGYNNGVLGENAEIVIADGKVDIDSKKCAYQSNVGITLGEDVEVLSPAGTEFKVLDGYYFLIDSASGTRIAKATIGTTKASYTVTFNKNGHGEDIAAATVKEGKTVAKPTAPTATGWVFGGWYTDADCTTEYDFTKAVTGDLELYAKWTKEKIDVSGVTLDKTAVSLVEEETVTLEATIAPDDATDKTVTWSSNKTDVATVDTNGKVTAVKAGTATITATATNGTDAATDD